jgi:glycosyltransferase involved in cell wall biosynthesis
MTFPRVAFFPDSFHEVNGVAHTARQFEAFARRRNLPFLCVRAGDRAQAVTEEGNVWTLELPRGILSVPLEKDLRFDPVFLRHVPLIGEVLERFQPEVIHITGPSEVGILGAGLAQLLNVPLAAGWHTNLHEYLVRRSDFLLRLLPERQSAATARKVQDMALGAAALFYSAARVLFAPNPELCAELSARAGRPCYLMTRGVDAVLFNPSKRPPPQCPSQLHSNGVAALESSLAMEPAVSYQGTTSVVPQQAALNNGALAPDTGISTECQGTTSVVPQQAALNHEALAPAEDREAILGFVGRLSVEKNIALLVELERELPRLGVTKFKFLIVGHGSHEAWLRERLHRAEFTGVLRGEELARAYARMDLFVFPSHTDTFGNAVLEAQASGVPAIVTPDGGPKTIVRAGETGLVVDDEEFASAIAQILANPTRHAQMRLAARAHAEKASWDTVFEGVYAAYRTVLPNRCAAGFCQPENGSAGA